MTSHKAAHDEFARLCASQSASEVTLANIRAIVLYQTQGLCSVHKLMDADTGTVLGVKAVCSATASDVRSRRFFSKNWRASMDQHVEKLMAQEHTTLPGKCMLNPLQMLTLKSFSHKSLATFRLAILESTSPPFDVRAIHFFRWDGTCRSSPEEIKKAMARYSSTKKGMATAWKVVLGVAVAASVLAAGAAVASRNPSVSATQDPESQEESQEEYVGRMVATFKNTTDKLHLLGRSKYALSSAIWTHGVNATRTRHKMASLLDSLYASRDSWVAIFTCLEFVSLDQAKSFLRTAILIFEPVGQEGEELKAAMRKYCNLSNTVSGEEVKAAQQSLLNKYQDAIEHDEGLLEQLEIWFPIQR